MTQERYYRGGERSPFKVSYIDGAVTLAPARSTVTLLNTPSGSQDRVKRLAVTVMLPKQTARATGWMAFYRVAHGADVDNLADIDMGDPQVLRPKVFVCNSDHAVYEQMYLEAINLDGGERILLLGYASQAVAIDYAAKWYSEVSLR